MAVQFPASLDSFQRKSNKPGTVVAADATQIYASGSAQIGDYNDLQIAIEKLEAKVGIDGSAVTSSLDYLLRSPSSLSPGHRHAHVYQSDGDNAALTTDTVGNVFLNPGSTASTWASGAAHNPGTFFYGSDGLNLYGFFLGHDNTTYGLTLISTSNNPDVLVGYHTANSAPATNQIGYGLKLNAQTSSLHFALGAPGTPPDWDNEVRLYLQPIVAGSGDTYSRLVNLRAAHLRIGPQDSTVRYAGSGKFSALLVLERSGDANDASILFKSGTPNQTYWSFEIPGTNNLSIKKVTGTHSPYAEVFSTVAWFDYTSGRMVLGAEGFSPQGMLHIYPAAVGQPSLVVDTKPSPTTDLQRWNLDGTTKIAVKSDFSLVQSAGFIAHSDTGAAQTLSTGNTITVTGTCARVSPSAAGQTGMILPAGTYANQKLVIYNEGGNSFTFNTTPATSRLAGAATAPALPANGAWTLHWNAALGLWFHAT